MAAGFSNTWRNLLVDALLRGEAITMPTTVFVALCSTAPTASAAGTELTGTGYVRQEIPCTLTDWSGTNGASSTAVSTGTTGTARNLAKVDYGDAGSNWGLAAYWELWSAETGGTRIAYGDIVNTDGIPAPRTIVTNDPVAFPIGALSFQIP